MQLSFHKSKENKNKFIYIMFWEINEWHKSVIIILS